MPQFIASQKGKRKLVVEDALFTFQKSGADGTEIWVCDQCKKGCKARVQTAHDEIVKSILQHNHEVRSERVQAGRVREEMRDLAKSTEEKPRTIISRVLSRVPHDVAVSELPCKENIGRFLRGCRRRAMPEVDVDHLETIEHQPFLRIASEGLRIFAASTDIEFLVGCVDWFADGTFKCAPEGFYQVYTIHGLCGSRSFPCVYALLCGKTERVYVEMLQKLKELEPALSPQTVTIDFEVSAMKAFQHEFPAAAIGGCKFHFGQCLWRQIQAKCLADAYRSDTSFTMQIKRLMALCYVPAADVVHVYEILRPTFDQRMSPILSYFERNFVGTSRARLFSAPVFPPGMWSLYTRTIANIPVTNNALEGWHCSFSKMIGAHHPSMELFARKLREEQHATAITREKLLRGISARSTRRRFDDVNALIRGVVGGYHEAEPLAYLNRLASILQIPLN